jgi:hypothetical protein
MSDVINFIHLLTATPNTNNTTTNTCQSQISNIMLRTMHSLRLRKISIQPSASSFHRPLHTSTRLFRPQSSSELGTSKPHNAESYFKDVDETAPSDPTIHRVDATSEAVQRPYEPPSGEWSQAGVRTREYEHVSGPGDKPYDVRDGDGEGGGLRYGGTEKLGAGAGTSHHREGEGVEGQSKGGRKPE